MTWKEKHARYLRTKHWKDLRTAAIKRDGGKCLECGSTDRLNVHHKVYRKPLRSGRLEDVATLCRRCHRLEHGLWVWEIRPFPILWKKLELRLRYCEFPSESDQILLASLIEDDQDRNYFDALMRHIAEMRVITTSAKIWSSWLAKPIEVRRRFWQWSKQKRLRLQGKVANVR